MSRLRKIWAFVALLAASAAYADPAGYLAPAEAQPATRAVQFRQASAPSQVFGCVMLGDFKMPDASWGAFARLKKLKDAGMDTALIVARDGATVQYIAYRCK